MCELTFFMDFIWDHRFTHLLQCQVMTVAVRDCPVQGVGYASRDVLPKRNKIPWCSSVFPWTLQPTARWIHWLVTTSQLLCCYHRAATLPLKTTFFALSINDFGLQCWPEQHNLCVTKPPIIDLKRPLGVFHGATRGQHLSRTFDISQL